MLKKAKKTKAAQAVQKITPTAKAPSRVGPITRPENTVPGRAKGREPKPAAPSRPGPAAEVRPIASTSVTPDPVNPKESIKTVRTQAHRMTAEPHPSSVSGDVYDAVVTRAHQIYVRRIRQGALDDWLQAEREILQQIKVHRPDVMQGGAYAAQELE